MIFFLTSSFPTRKTQINLERFSFFINKFFANCIGTKMHPVSSSRKRNAFLSFGRRRRGNILSQHRVGRVQGEVFSSKTEEFHLIRIGNSLGKKRIHISCTRQSRWQLWWRSIRIFLHQLIRIDCAVLFIITIMKDEIVLRWWCQKFIGFTIAFCEGWVWKVTKWNCYWRSFCKYCFCFITILFQ